MLIAATLEQPDQTPPQEPLADLADAELARRALTNDPLVWAEFVRRFEPLIRKQLGRAMARGRRVGSSRVDLQACKLEYSIVSPK